MQTSTNSNLEPISISSKKKLNYTTDTGAFVGRKDKSRRRKPLKVFECLEQRLSILELELATTTDWE